MPIFRSYSNPFRSFFFKPGGYFAQSKPDNQSNITRNPQGGIKLATRLQRIFGKALAVQVQVLNAPNNVSIKTVYLNKKSAIKYLNDNSPEKPFTKDLQEVADKVNQFLNPKTTPSIRDVLLAQFVPPQNQQRADSSSSDKDSGQGSSAASSRSTSPKSISSTNSIGSTSSGGSTESRFSRTSTRSEKERRRLVASFVNVIEGPQQQQLYDGLPANQQPDGLV